MKIVRSAKNLTATLKNYRLKNKNVGFVPTMGALHEGHLSLIRKARQENDIVVVSIFVNPTQFGPKEDFRRYPRPIAKDILLCKKKGVDFVFYPQPEEMYPAGFRTYVTVEGLSDVLCGKSRPGHFRAVATVVAKLFNIVQPDAAYFGQKDAQQAIIIKRMVEDLNIPVKIKVMPIVRGKDGLALSSRNIYLNEKERKDALVLYESLNLAKDLSRRHKTAPPLAGRMEPGRDSAQQRTPEAFSPGGAPLKKGIRDAGKMALIMRQFIKRKRTARIDYISIVDTKDLRPVKKISGGCLIALAVWIGKTRVIDNMVVRL